MAATLLDAPRSPNPAKLEEFVEAQLTAARRRVRVLDVFLAGLVLAVASLAFLFVVLLIDRYVETPHGLGWGVFGLYIAMAAGFLYVAVLRPSRRMINPYFAARQVEQTVANAKNSLVTWVDFEEDERLPGSIRTAIGQKAARDLKGVDLNRAIENRKILWLGICAGIFLFANVVVFFLPATRTELTIEDPKKGDTTVFNNQDVAFSVRVKGRVPSPNAADAVRLRMWYNPDDPESFEERLLKASEEDHRVFNLIVPAKQVRNGFHYKVLAGNTQTPEYTVTCKIVPEFTGFEVTYQYPAYLKRAPRRATIRTCSHPMAARQRSSCPRTARSSAGTSRSSARRERSTANSSRAGRTRFSSRCRSRRKASSTSGTPRPKATRTRTRRACGWA